jgi:hypothetical protein
LGGGRREGKGAPALVAIRLSFFISYTKRAAVLPESVTIWKAIYRHQDAVF